MDRKKIIASIYNLKKHIESLEESLYGIKTKDKKYDVHLNNAKFQASNIVKILKSDLYELQNEFEANIHEELSEKSSDNFLKINSPNADAKNNMKKILNLRRVLINDAIKEKKAADN